jgi:hypothetical protein
MILKAPLSSSCGLVQPIGRVAWLLSMILLLALAARGSTDSFVCDQDQVANSEWKITTQEGVVSAYAVLKSGRKTVAASSL